jgi:hypothetical protein
METKTKKLIEDGKQIKLIPDFLKTYFNADDIRDVPLSWKESKRFKRLFFLTSFHSESKVFSNVRSIYSYLGMEVPEYIKNTYSNPSYLIEKNELLDKESFLKSNQFGSSILFKDRDSGLKFLDKLNAWLEREYRELEDKIRVNILISGEKEEEYLSDNVIVTSKNLLGHFNRELNINYFFRTLEIVSVSKQSSYAIEAYVRFHTEVCGQCHICGRGLDDDFSRKVGIGPVCCRTKLNIKKIDNILEVSNKIKKFAEDIGTIGPILIPKSQIKKLR